MPENTFKLEIVTPERVVLSENVISVTVPGVEGSFGVLANHAPLMAELTFGEIRIRNSAGDMIRLATSGGFMEVRDNEARILADTAEKAEEIDVARAQEAKRRAEERLHTHQEHVDYARAESSLKRALTRLRVAQNYD